MKAKSSKLSTKPWSTKKRVYTAAGLSLLILAAAFVIGGLMYVGGTKMKLIQTQSIKDAVMEKAMDNDDLADAFVDSMKLTDCENQFYGFGVRYPESMSLKEADGGEKCREFTTINSMGTESVIKITPWPVNKDQALEIVLSGKDEVVTESFIHEKYEGVMVMGIRGGSAEVAIIIPTSNTMSFVFEATPVDVLAEQRMKALAKELVKW
jgi:hypothetical protein